MFAGFGEDGDHKDQFETDVRQKDVASTFLGEADKSTDSVKTT